MRWAERRARVGGTELLVRSIGEGPPVVLFNGIGAHVEMWRPLERALSGLRVVSFDAPGTGRSRALPVPATMGRLATLAEGLFDALGLERADVLGYSLGGALAQQFAVQAPERVRRLVLAATLPGWGGVPGELPALLALATPLRYRSRTYYERTAGTIAGGRARRDHAHVQRLWRDRSGHSPSLRGYAHQLVAGMLFSSLRWLERIRAPTLVLTGDDDPLVPVSNALLMASRIPRARVCLVRGEGHFLLLDDHSPALAAIGEFLTAERLDDAPAWRSAIQPDAAQLRQQLRADGLGALPWGAVSALVRQVVAP